MSDYVISYKEIESYSIEKLVQLVKDRKGILLKNLTIKDLVFNGSKDIRTGNGVYVFKDIERNIYVGKCSSRNFVERIPAHFDIRHNGWFNSLLRNLVKNGEKIADDENLTKAARYSFDNLSLLLINFEDYDKDKINNLENLLRIVLKPLNQFKRKKFSERERLVCDVINTKV